MRNPPETRTAPVDPRRCAAPRAPGRRVGRVAALLVTLIAAPSAALAASYTVDETRSTLTIKVEKAGLLSGLGHDHTIRATKLAGRLELDPLRPEGATVFFEVAAASLRVADRIDADDKAKIERSMHETVLKVRRYPRIRFRSEKVKLRSAEKGTLRLTVAGLLTLRGRRRGIVLEVKVVTGADGTLTATGAYRLRQSDYGIELVSALLGTVTVKDDVVISFRVAARPAAPAPAPGKKTIR